MNLLNVPSKPFLTPLFMPTMQGMIRLGLIFNQLSVGSLAVSTTCALEAAVKYPAIVGVSSATFFTLARERDG